MKALSLILFASLLLPLKASAQEMQKLQPRSVNQSSDAPRFANIPWGTETDLIKSKLTSAGFKFTKVDESGDLWFSGQVLNKDATVFAVMSPTNGLARILVVVYGDEGDVRSTYNTMRARLMDKYGTPIDIERWQYPYDEDDDPDHFFTAIRIDKLVYGAAFKDYQLTMQIDSDLDLTIFYSGPFWEEEKLRRQKASTDVF